MSLIGIEEGSGVLVIESESQTLIDVPGSAFEEMIVEANSSRSDRKLGNAGMQRAILALGALFRWDSNVEDIELVSDSGSRAKIDANTIRSIESAFAQGAVEDGAQTLQITGRLLEIDLARKSFRIHGHLDDISTIAYADLLETVVVDALDCFVSVTVLAAAGGARDLISLLSFVDVPETRFHERRTLEEIADEQGVSELINLDSLALSDASQVPQAEFQAFVKDLRRGSAM
jgi:hypothetical protein